MRRLTVIVTIMLLFTMPLTSLAAGDVYETAEKLVYTNSDTTLPYRLILPENYTGEQKYPLLFFFHGAGERGNDNELQLFHCIQYLADNLPEVIIVAPQCPLNNQWVDTPWSMGAYSIESVPESNEMKAVIELIDSLTEQYSVDTDRIYASGISMGGFATWDAMMRHNDIFAAGIAVCGGGDPSQAENLVDVPLFVFHGDSDSAVPVSGSRDTVAAIKEAGGTKVEYVEYEGADHGIWNNAFATEDLLQKLLDCRLSDRYPTEVSEESVEESVFDESGAQQESGFLPRYLIPIIAVAVICIGVAAYFIFKSRT